MVYDLMEKEAASTVDSDEAALQEEEEQLMQARADVKCLYQCLI